MTIFFVYFLYWGRNPNFYCHPELVSGSYVLEIPKLSEMSSSGTPASAVRNDRLFVLPYPIPSCMQSRDGRNCTFHLFSSVEQIENVNTPFYSSCYEHYMLKYYKNKHMRIQYKHKCYILQGKCLPIRIKIETLHFTCKHYSQA